MSKTTSERDRFVALCFCRADLLLELDDEQKIIFAAGTALPALGKKDIELIGKPFLELIASEDRQLAGDMLRVAENHGRMDDVLVRLSAAGGRTPKAAIAGYRVPDFNNHFFIAVKIEPALATRGQEYYNRHPESGLMEEKTYSGAAAERVTSFQRAGGEAQISLVKVDNLGDLLQTLGTSERKKLLGTIGTILRSHSLGGDSAGIINDENFSFVHETSVDAEDVNREIEGVANKYADQAGVEVTSRAQTLDADGAGMTQGQVAKAIVHTMQTFCDQDGMLFRASLSEELSAAMTNTMEDIAYFKKASSEGDFSLAFMPICDLRLGKVHHFELLARFREPRGGKSPFHLIRLAEEVGIIQEFDLAVARKAISAVAEMSGKEKLPPVAVNLSGLSISDSTFCDRLHHILKKTGVPSHAITFEITESAKVEDLDHVNTLIQTFRRKGYKFALDDFGSGAAGFDYLNLLDVDFVKFDGPVVRRACSTRKGYDMLGRMAKLCQTAGVKTVAEMVEDKRIASHLYNSGIDFGQGWYFGKPTFNPFVYSDNFAARLLAE